MPCQKRRKNGKKLYYRIKCASDKNCYYLKGAVTSAGLIGIGYVANVQQSAASVTGIKFLTMLIPAIFLIVSIIVFITYPLTEMRVAQMLADIEERNVHA